MRLHARQLGVCLFETCQGLTFCKSKLQKVKPACWCGLPAATSPYWGGCLRQAWDSIWFPANENICFAPVKEAF